LTYKGPGVKRGNKLFTNICTSDAQPHFYHVQLYPGENYDVPLGQVY